MLYKDACNRKSNQQNLGTIKCSNLCTEIVEYSSPDEIAVCNLASIAVNQFVDTKTDAAAKYDFEKLKEVTKVATKNLNKIIDVNYYPGIVIKHHCSGIATLKKPPRPISKWYPNIEWSLLQCRKPTNQIQDTAQLALAYKGWPMHLF